MDKVLGEVQEQKEANLRNLTSIHIGGTADFLVRPPTLEHLIQIVEECREKGIPFYPVGRASNVIFAERVPGKVILTTMVDGINVYPDECIIKAQCGAYLGTLASAAKSYSLSGLEYLYEIPGTLGGGIFMNCGFRDHSISEIVKKVYALSPNGELVEFDSKDLDFGHRKSIFQKEDYNDWVILYADLQLREEDPQKIQRLMEENSEVRKRIHPWGERSIGCVFVNKSPTYVVNEKLLTADQLIRGAGCAGWKEGSIYVSPKYTPFFINGNGENSIKPFIELVNKVYQAVLSKYSVSLKIEVKVIPSMKLIG